MAVSATYDNVQWPGGDGLRVPQERAGNRLIPTSLQTYSEADLGTVATSPYNLTAQQAGASLITVNPTVALALVFPVCQPGQKTIIQNTNVTNAITASVSGNTNTASVGTSSVAMVVQTGTNGGIVLVTGT
jgi:hypothetical protein